MSGGAFHYWAHYETNNHLDLFRETLKNELGNQTSDEDVFNFVLNSSTELLVQKIPAFHFPNGLLNFFWGAIIEGI